jgi:cell division protein FtsQ
MSRGAVAPRRTPPSAGIAAPADRRFRRSDLSLRRLRSGRLIGRAAVWALTVVATVSVSTWLVDRLLHASVLNIDRVTVSGTRRLSEGDVRALVQDLRGANILQVDFAPFRSRVLDSPWVADVSFGRVLPAAVDVQVVERRPLAIARLGQQLYLVDAAGVIIDEYGAAHHDLDLPVVDGLVMSHGSGSQVQVEGIEATAALLADLATRPDLSDRLSQIDVTNPHDVVVMFDHDAAWLHLGNEQFLARLAMYLELVPTLSERFTAIDYVDLRFGARVFVRAKASGRPARRDAPAPIDPSNARETSESRIAE